MSVSYQCDDGNGGGQSIQLTTVSGGVAQSVIPNFGAVRINLTFMDVQQSIKAGRANGPIKPFNLSGSTDMKN